jgi:hypothetical protein
MPVYSGLSYRRGRLMFIIANESFHAVNKCFVFPLQVSRKETAGILMSLQEMIRIFSIIPMLSGSPVTTAWRVLRLRMEETASRYGG